MLSQITKAMRSEGITEQVIRSFSVYYQKVAEGETGMLPESEINPPSAENLVDYGDLTQYKRNDILRNIVVIKLNGGLGTSMGLTKAKSLIPVKGNMNFLDIIARQVLTLRAQTGYDVLMLLMNSFNTDFDSLQYLSKYPDLAKQDIPLSFVQNKYPRIRQDNLKLFESSNKNQIWNPPGHGDLYSAITNNNLLDRLIDRGYRYAFVSNSDNLGATIETTIPSYMEANGIQFMMEVCKRTVNDKKGGHLCEDKRGQLMLREIAQCPVDDQDNFQDINRYSYFNTNNLWIDLKALQWNLISGDGMILLPLIVNPKVVDDTPVYQLETAMGAAISVFNKARAVVVPRDRFAPVKKNSDLLALWSDVFELNDQYQMVLKRGLSTAPKIDLDDKYYATIDDMLRKFAGGVPSLSACKELKIEGDVSFGDEVICEGRVHIKAGSQTHIKSRFLTGEIQY